MNFIPASWRFVPPKRPKAKQIDLAMISTFGVKHNMYYEDLVQNEVLLDDLFR